MRIFFDTEFIENGSYHFPQLVSIGAVREDGATYYAELAGVDWSLANSFVLENVAPHLVGGDCVKTAPQVMANLQGFAGENPEFWAYFADYDWVLLASLSGKMVDLPKGWPFFCRDLKQLMWHLNIHKEDIPVELHEDLNQHQALDDAMWNMRVYNWIKENYDGYLEPINF